MIIIQSAQPGGSNKLPALEAETELSSLARQMQGGLDKEGRSKHQKALPIKSSRTVYVKECSGMSADPNEKAAKSQREMANLD